MIPTAARTSAKPTLTRLWRCWSLYCGAQVYFVDIDPRTYNLCPLALESKLLAAEKAGKLPKVLVAVHLYGLPCDMAAIQALGQKYCFRSIEDASHAIGGRYKDKGDFIGKSRYSDITVFSFHPVKIVTTAEDGMALTNSDELATQMVLLRSHGITRTSRAVLRRGHQPTHVSNLERQPARPSGGCAAKGSSRMMLAISPARGGSKRMPRKTSSFFLISNDFQLRLSRSLISLGLCRAMKFTINLRDNLIECFKKSPFGLVKMDNAESHC